MRELSDAVDVHFVCKLNEGGTVKMREKTVLLAVNGTLMRGLALEGNLLRVGASFCRETKTEGRYRLWSVRDAYPAMLRTAADDPAARAVAVEVWSVPADGVATILAGEPDGLCIGKVRLADGEIVFGVLGEPETVAGMKEITSFGGWRGYIASDDFGG